VKSSGRMKAVVLGANSATLVETSMPTLQTSKSVLLKVTCAGVCKTDVWVAKGVIAGNLGYPLGHEFCGEVVQRGGDAEKFELTQQVAVNPIIPCCQCDDCRSGHQNLCAYTTMLGIDHPGAFAEYVSVPESQCYAINGLSPTLAAYAEPVAAALSIKQIEFACTDRVGLVGDDRISGLNRFVLKTMNVSIVEPSADHPVDTLIVTSTDHLELNHVKAGGTIILKGRSPHPWHLHSIDIVRKRLKIIALNYAPFDEAIAFLHQHAEELHAFLGQCFSLSQFDQAFSANDYKKVFINPCVD